MRCSAAASTSIDVPPVSTESPSPPLVAEGRGQSFFTWGACVAKRPCKSLNKRIKFRTFRRARAPTPASWDLPGAAGRRCGRSAVSVSARSRPPLTELEAGRASSCPALGGFERHAKSNPRLQCVVEVSRRDSGDRLLLPPPLRPEVDGVTPLTWPKAPFVTMLG